MTLAFLAGIVGLFSLNASRRIVRSFEGGEEYSQDIFQASTELAGLTKKMEGHLMLYLFLDDGLDRDKFFQINELLQDKISFLEKNIQFSDGIVRSGTNPCIAERKTCFSRQPFSFNEAGIDAQNSANL